MATKFAGLVILILSALLITGCGDDQSQDSESKDASPYVVVVNNPLLYFTRRLIGDTVEVRLLAPADIDPATWRPSVADVLQLQAAELVMLNGAAYSGWLDKVALSPGKQVVTSASAKDRWIARDGGVTHSHGPGGEHAHGDYAFTTWMDMNLARIQAETVSVALQQRWPEQSDTIAANLRELVNDLDFLDQSYREQTAQLAGRQIVYSHPVYQYFERRYQLPGRSLHWEPDAMPSDEQWAELEQMIDESSLFVWEGEPATAIQERMTKLGLAWVVIDPAANVGDSDWLSVQRDNIERYSGRG